MALDLKGGALYLKVKSFLFSNGKHLHVIERRDLVKDSKGIIVQFESREEAEAAIEGYWKLTSAQARRRKPSALRRRTSRSKPQHPGTKNKLKRRAK